MNSTLIDQIDALCERLSVALAPGVLPERWRDHLNNARRFAVAGEAGAAAYEIRVLESLATAPV